MFLAIINDTYAEVKSEISQDSNEFELVDYFKKGYNNFLSKLGKRDQIADLHNAMKLADSDGDNKLSFEEVRRKLKQQNFSEAEIEMWFAKYDIDGNRQLDEQETRQMLADLEGQKLQLDREIEKEQQMPSDASRPASAVGGRSGVSLDDFHVLSRRVDRMEHSIGSIVSKIDAVLVKMESMESAKTKRRDNMNKILDTISEHDGLDEKAKRQQMEQLVREELQRWDSDISMNSPRFNENNT
ncbi:polycystin-2-like [Centruroides sculpturatus]|nr:polycystin-2-like [Centruroides sculpturatus]